MVFTCTGCIIVLIRSMLLEWMAVVIHLLFQFTILSPSQEEFNNHPVHQTFEADGFVVCSFVPRLYDYHLHAIPAPYHHSNIDSDEVLYYVDGDFMSRKHVTERDDQTASRWNTAWPTPGLWKKASELRKQKN